MRFNGDLAFTGDILSWAKLDDEGYVTLVFDGGGTETVLRFSESTIRPVFAALEKILAGEKIIQNLEPGKSGRGSVILESAVIDPAGGPVVFGGYDALDEKGLSCPTVTVADKTGTIELALGDRQARELVSRFNKILGARQSLREVLRSKTISEAPSKA